MKPSSKERCHELPKSVPRSSIGLRGVDRIPAVRTAFGVLLNIGPDEDRCFFLRCYRNPVLARIIADLDELAGYPPSAAESRTEGKTAEARRAHHRRRLAEPDPPPKRLTVQEERAALWDALGHPPSKRKR
jgi:hypothetical protein